MEQIDPSSIAVDLFNRLLPEALSSRVPTLPRLNALRRTLSSRSSHKNAPAPAPAPPLPSRQPSATTPTADAGGKLPRPGPSSSSTSDTLVSDSETDMISYPSHSSRGSSKNGSVSGFDYALSLPTPSAHQQLGPLLSPPCVEDQQLRLLQVAGKPRRPEDRLDPGFGAHSYDGVDCRWSPSGIKWRYARQGAHLTSSASLEQDDPSFERRSYIDGVAYYLRGCPDTLSELETDILVRSAPWLAESRRPAPAAAAPRQPSDRGQTFLHQAVRLYIVGAVVVAHALWCCLVAVGHLGWQCEVQYSVSSQIVARGHTIANAFGKHGVGLSARIQRFCQGRAGQLMGGFAGWVLESLAGGIQDGYIDGIGMIQGLSSGGLKV